MTRQTKSIVDDSHWYEVEHINGYAVFMGHLSRAVRELGFLVVAWSTVVLLGGFVSALETKDFWSVAGITLIQTTGVFDAFRKEKLRNVWHASKRLFVSTLLCTNEEPGPQAGCRSAFLASLLFHMLAVAKMLIQSVIFTITLLPPASIHLFGIYISSGISLCRLVQREYCVKRRDASNPNLVPALDTLYSITLLQGVLFCYKSLSSLGEKNVLNRVVTHYKLDGHQTPDWIQDYMDETKAGCDKDLSFATGRNLITYAVELMESRSPSSYISGMMILDSLIGLKESSSSGHTGNYDPLRDRVLSDQKELVKQLIGPQSPSQVLHRMIQTLDSRSPYDAEVKKCAARMVVFFAGVIRLEQFPGGIQCITSLLTMGGPNELLLLQGLRILQALATEDNCRLMRKARVMSTAQGLLSKIAMPIGLDLHHCEQHGIAHCLLELIGRLRDSAPGGSETL